MAMNLCAVCGQPVGLSTEGFCPNCGAVLAKVPTEGPTVPPDYQPYVPQFAFEAATPPPITALPSLPSPSSPPPLPSSTVAAVPTSYAISPGRATGVAFAVMGVMFVLEIINFFPYLSHGSDFQFYSSFQITDMLVIAGVFWYGILRLAHDRGVRVWLISSAASTLMLGVSTLVSLYLGYYNRSYFPFTSDSFFWLRLLLNTVIIAMGYSAIGVGLASGFARWRDLRSISTSRQNIQDFLLGFGRVVGVWVAYYGTLFIVLTVDAGHSGYLD